MNPFIQNVAYVDVVKGNHIDPGPNSMLIQITDVNMDPPTPKYQFTEVHQFQFLDVDNSSEAMFEFAMTPEQAKEIVSLLKHALENKMTVIVHCVAGLCRSGSGAVAEVGTMMGFQDTGTYRSPNTWVKYLLMKDLGWTYDSE